MPFVNPIISEAREEVLKRQYAMDDALAAARAAEAEAVKGMETVLRAMMDCDFNSDNCSSLSVASNRIRVIAKAAIDIYDTARAERVRLEGEKNETIC